MSKNLKVVIAVALVWLGLMGIHPLLGAPHIDLADEALTKMVLFDGGYIPHLELQGNTLVVSTIDAIRVFDLSQELAQETQTYAPAYNRVTALNPNGDWIAFNLPGVDGDSFFVLPLSDLTSGHAHEGYAFRQDIHRVNDLLLDANLMTYAALDTGDIWFAQEIGDPIIVQAHAGGATTLSRSLTGQLASGGADDTVKLWNGQSIAETLSFEQPVQQVSWSPVADTLAILLADGTLSLWQNNTLEAFPAIATTLAWSPDGTQLALGQTSGEIQIWDVTPQTEITRLSAHSRQVTALAWGDRALISAGLDGQVQIWDQQWSVQQSLNVIRCCFQHLTGNGTRFLFRQGAIIWEWNNQAQSLNPVFWDDRKITTMVLSPSGNYLATQEYVQTYKNFLVLYERQTDGQYQQIATYMENLGELTVIDMLFRSDEESLIATAMMSNRGVLLDLSIPALTILSQKPIENYPRGLTFAPDGSIAFVTNERFLNIINTNGDLQEARYHLQPVYNMQYSLDGRYLAFGTDASAAVIDLTDPEFATEVCFSNAPGVYGPGTSPHDPTYAAIASSGSLLICSNIELTLYDLNQEMTIQAYPQGEVELEYYGTSGLQLSSDERQIFILYGNEFQVWQAETTTPTTTP